MKRSGHTKVNLKESAYTATWRSSMLCWTYSNLKISIQDQSKWCILVCFWLTFNFQHIQNDIPDINLNLCRHLPDGKVYICMLMSRATGSYYCQEFYHVFYYLFLHRINSVGKGWHHRHGNAWDIFSTGSPFSNLYLIINDFIANIVKFAKMKLILLSWMVLRLKPAFIA